MTTPIAKDIKIFVPAKNFDESLRFYQALGWKANFVVEDDLLLSWSWLISAFNGIPAAFCCIFPES